MNTKVYVDGGILIITPFFKYENAIALYKTPPVGAEIFIPQDKIENEPCLIITEEKAPSIFKEYYAKTFFTTKYSWAPFFSNGTKDCLDFFSTRISEIIKLTALSASLEIQQIIYRQSVVSLVASLDTFVSDLVLYRATKDKDSFISVVNTLNVSANKKIDLLTRIIRMWDTNAIDSAEQEVIDFVLRNSYSSLDEIKKFLRLLYAVTIQDNDNVKNIIKLRHLIAHRNGRKKDGTIITLSKENITDYIRHIDNFVQSIYNMITQTISDK